MDKNDILDYVTETPGNTNRAVLGSMLDSFAGSGGVNLHTATLTIVGSSDTAVIGFNPYLNESTGYLEINENAPLAGSYVIPLFSDEGGGGTSSADIWNNGEQLSMTSSGDITIVEEQEPETGEYVYLATITGDCTITLA